MDSDGEQPRREPAKHPQAGESLADQISRPYRDRRLRRLPSLLASALQLVWRAAPAGFARAAALQVIGGVGLAAQLALGRALLDRLLADQGLGNLWWLLLGLAVATTVAAFTVSAGAEQQRLLAELVARRATSEVVEVAGAAELIDFEEPGFHDHLQRARASAAGRPSQVASAVLSLLSGAVALVAVAGALIGVAPALVLLVLGAYVPTWLATRAASRSEYGYAFRQTPRDRERAYLYGLLTQKEAAAELRGFEAIGTLIRRHNSLYDARIADLGTLVRSRLRVLLAGSALTSTLSVGVLAVLVSLVGSGQINLADAAVAAGAVLVLGSRLQSVSKGAGSLYESGLFLEDYQAFVEGRRRATQAPGTALPPFGTLRLESVSFRYPARSQPSLEEVSLDIRAGEVVALVGENGSGKTTLTKILAGLYEPSQGRILRDGTDYRDLDPVALRRSATAVFQEFGRYHLSVLDNVALSDPAAPDASARAAVALRRAGADGIVAALPHGLESRLGPEFFGGSDLSLGQWQRLSLARAFYRDAPLLLLDEPTASLDARAEHELFERVRELFADRTVVLVSHRFSSVRHADRIFVLHGGRIVERGSHEELLLAGGRYAEMFRLQAAAYLQDDAESAAT